MSFFRNQWNPLNQPSRPRYPPTARPVPLRPRNTPSPSAKVVHIPVHFVGSEQKRSASAVKIQKVFRGHMIRKSVKKIASIKRDVEEVEKTISRREIVDSIRRDHKERVRLNEALMSLLFKLDSVRGVDSGVRVLWKAVIKKAIALQERVDDIASGKLTLEFVEQDRSVSGEVETLETLEIDEQGPEIETIQIGENCEKKETLEIEDEYHPQIEANQDGSVVEEEEDMKEQKTLLIKDGEIGGDQEMGMEELANSGEDAISCSNNSEKNCEKSDSAGHEKMDISEYVIVDDKVEDDTPLCVKMDPAVEEMAENPNEVTSPTTTMTLKMRNEVENQKQDKDNTTTEMLEKMMEENKKMMSMMKQLFESNETQTRMINSLSQRVGQLEKAFVCDRLRRKKRQSGSGDGGGSGSSPDQKKFGKR